MPLMWAGCVEGVIVLLQHAHFLSLKSTLCFYHVCLALWMWRWTYNSCWPWWAPDYQSYCRTIFLSQGHFREGPEIKVWLPGGQRRTLGVEWTVLGSGLVFLDGAGHLSIFIRIRKCIAWGGFGFASVVEGSHWSSLVITEAQSRFRKLALSFLGTVAWKGMRLRINELFGQIPDGVMAWMKVTEVALEIMGQVWAMWRSPGWDSSPDLNWLAGEEGLEGLNGR